MPRLSAHAWLVQAEGCDPQSAHQAMRAGRHKNWAELSLLYLFSLSEPQKDGRSARAWIRVRSATPENPHLQSPEPALRSLHVHSQTQGLFAPSQVRHPELPCP